MIKKRQSHLEQTNKKETVNDFFIYELRGHQKVCSVRYRSEQRSGFHKRLNTHCNYVANLKKKNVLWAFLRNKL